MKEQVLAENAYVNRKTALAMSSSMCICVCDVDKKLKKCRHVGEVCRKANSQVVRISSGNQKKRGNVSMYSVNARGWMMFVEKEQPRVPIGPEYTPDDKLVDD